MNHSTQCFASTCSPKMQHRIDRRVWLILGVLQALCQVAVADESRSLVVQTTPAHSPYLLEWTGNDELIVTKSRGGEIRVWRTDSGNLVQSLPSAGPKDGFAVSDDGAFVAAISEARVSVAERHSRRVAWQSPETEIIRSLTGLIPPHLMICDGTEVRRVNYVNNVVTHRWKVGQNEGIRQICGLSNGHTVAFLEGRGVVIMDTDLKEVGSIPSDRSKSLYYGLASRDGKALALAAFDGTWIGSTDQLGAGWSRAAKSPGASGVALSSKGDRLAFGTFGRSLVVQSPPGADGIAEWPTIRTIDKMAWNRADTKLALVTQRNGVVIVDAKSGEELRFFGVPVPAGAIKFDARATWLG